MELPSDEKVVLLRKASHSLYLVIPSDFTEVLKLFKEQPCYMRLNRKENQLILTFQKTALLAPKKSPEEDLFFDPFSPKNTE